jgi:hypothetical protein
MDSLQKTTMGTLFRTLTTQAATADRLFLQPHPRTKQHWPEYPVVLSCH